MALTYNFGYAPHGPGDWAAVKMTGGRRKALVAIRKLYPDRKDWKFLSTISDTGLIRT